MTPTPLPDREALKAAHPDIAGAQLLKAEASLSQSNFGLAEPPSHGVSG